jgi:hypothetical protein
MNTPRALGAAFSVLVALAAPAASAQSKVTAAPGLVIERIVASVAPTAPAGDRIITLVRVDPARFAFRFINESHDGRRRPLPQWVRDEGLTGGINAGMFLPSGQSCGYLKLLDEVRSDRSPSSFTGVLGFDPVSKQAPFAAGGLGCAHDLGWFKRSYRSVLQAYRVMVDTEGRAVEWPHTRRFSTAAIGVDRDGWAVLIHSRTPYQPTVLNRMLAEPTLGLRGVVYMEGGPEASLVVEAGSASVRDMGSWEDGFNANDDNRVFWDLPNVIGFAPRPAPGA